MRNVNRVVCAVRATKREGRSYRTSYFGRGLIGLWRWKSTRRCQIGLLDFEGTDQLVANLGGVSMYVVALRSAFRVEMNFLGCVLLMLVDKSRIQGFALCILYTPYVP